MPRYLVEVSQKVTVLQYAKTEVEAESPTLAKQKVQDMFSDALDWKNVKLFHQEAMQIGEPIEVTEDIPLPLKGK